jgi:hypothetical protein
MSTITLIEERPKDRSSIPNCYECIHRNDLFHSAHSSCDALTAEVSCVKYGYTKGWFYWPVNFDPVWILCCNKFEQI